MTTETRTITHCTKCGNEFDEQEINDPYLDKGSNNAPICAQCYRDYETFCPLCEDLFDKPLQWTPNQFIYANEGVDVPGIYRVLSWPFFTSCYIDAWFNDDAIKLEKPLPDTDADGDFICPDCVKKYQLLP